MSQDELDRIAEAYDRRTHTIDKSFARLIRAEREPIYKTFLTEPDRPPLSQIELLKVGCGGGTELKRFLKMGMSPDRVQGFELLPQRAASARALLPQEVRIHDGDASQMDFPDHSFDVIFASTVFSSILDQDLRRRLAHRMWQVTRPRGLVLWYDFTVNNPRNPDVRGVSKEDVLELFPDANATFVRTTLAPPIGRTIAPLGPIPYRLLSAVRPLRTHLVAALRKNAGPSA